jgi:glycosyltransferase involved in cell wall biosynthesis
MAAMADCDDRAVSAPRLSVIITAHNEGAEARLTVESVREGAADPCEILLVDDGSTDGCCDFAAGAGVRVIRREARVGVASARDLAAGQANGEVLVFLDAHQRVERGSLEKSAEVALARNAIVAPDLCDFGSPIRLHGAYFVHGSDGRWLSAQWKVRQPSAPLTRINALRAPAYALPRRVYQKLRWSPALRGWGGTEAALLVKAFFAGVEILHLCGPLVQHKFKRSFHYEVGWHELWRNQALTARICFEERTWRRYWWPLFEEHFTAEDRRELDSAELLAERDEFAKHKVRHDHEFWTRLAYRKVPAVLIDDENRAALPG